MAEVSALLLTRSRSADLNSATMSDTLEKPAVIEADESDNGGTQKDALGLASERTLESFAHLDEKKILRKVC